MKESKAQKVLRGNESYETVYKNKKIRLESIDKESGVALASVIDTGEKMKIPVDELGPREFEFK